MRRAVADTMVVIDEGTTNQGFLLELLDRPELRAGAVDTGWLDRLQAAGRRRVRAARRRGACPGGDRARRRGNRRRPRELLCARAPRAPAGAPQPRLLVDLRHRGQAYRMRVWHIGPGRRRLAVDGAVVDVRVEFLSEHERRLTLESDTTRRLSRTRARTSSSRSTACRTA